MTRPDSASLCNVRRTVISETSKFAAISEMEAVPLALTRRSTSARRSKGAWTAGPLLKFNRLSVNY